jgi:Na+/proline symporter
MNSTSLAHPIDIGIFVVFLALNLILGLRYGSRVKTIRDYAIGNKDFSTATLTATIVATWVTGSFFVYVVEQVYSRGLYFIIGSTLGGFVGILLTGVVGEKMGNFLNNLSVAEAMGDMYGKKVRVITASSGVFNLLGWLAVQFQVIAKVLSIIFGLEGPFVTILVAIIVIIYTSSGGIRAVTFTDVVQFITFGTIIPAVALVIWSKIPNANHLVQQTLNSTSHFSLKEVVGFTPEFMSSLGWLVCFSVPAIAPEVFQRIAMANNTAQVRKSFTYSAGIILTIEMFVVWIAILLLSSKAGLSKEQIFPYLLKEYAYTGLKGLLGVGIVAMAMSSADSFLNSAAVMLANDISTPLSYTQSSRVLTARLATLLVGCLGAILALYTNDLLEMVLLACSLYLPIVTVPFLLSVFGFRSSTRAVLIGMTFGFLTVLLWSIFLKNSDSMVPGMLANIIGLMGSHYMFREKGGWQQLAPDSPLALERAARRQHWQWRLNAIRSFRLYPYLRQNLPNQEGFYFFFGLYTIAATYTAFYTVGDVESQAYQAINTGIYYTVLPVITAFLTLAIWPDSLKKSRFIVFFWPLGIGGILFFAGTLLVIMSHFHHMQVMVMMVNLLMAVLLLRWPLALFLAFIGMALAVSFFKHYTGTPLPTGELAAGSLQLKIMYGLLLFTSFLIALFKGKQAYKRLSTSHEQLRKERSVSSTELIEALHHRERLVREVTTDKAEAIVTIKQMRKKLDDALKGATTEEQLGVVNQDFQATLDKLHLLTEYLDQVTYQTQGYMRLEVGTVSLSGLLNDVFDSLGKQDSMFAKQVLTQQHTTDQPLQADIGKLKQLLVDSLCYAQQHKQENMPILVSIEETSLGYPISAIQGYIKEISALCFIITTASTLPTHSTLYMVSVDRAAIRLPKDATELPITHNQQIVEAHYGTSEFIESEQGITQIYVIPVRVREVRPQTMDLLSATEIMSDTAIYPEEVAFVKAVTEKTQVDMAMLQKALQLIKKHHAGVERKSGEPFYLHPIAVAKILLDYTQEQDTIVAALLHDTLEDTSLSLAQVALIFNPVVTTIVDGVTHLDSNLKNFKRIQLSAHENIQQLLEVKDERILYVKLADRLHNMRTIEGHSSLAKQQRIAKETLQFFVPMAKSIGLAPIAEELKRRSFAVLNVK